MTSEELDNLFRKEVNDLKGLPPQVSWRKEQGWQKLNAQLNPTEDKRGVVPLWQFSKHSSWVYSIAATLSLTILSIVGINHWASQENFSLANLSGFDQESSHPLVKQDTPPQLPLMEKALHYEKMQNHNDANLSSIQPIVMQDQGLLDQLYFGNYTTSENSKKQNRYALANFDGNDNLLVNAIRGIHGGTNVQSFQPKYESLSFYNYGPIPMNKKTKEWSFVVDGFIGANTMNFNGGVEVNLVRQFKGKKHNVDQSFAVGIRNEFHFVHDDRYNKSEFQMDNPSKKQNNLGGATFITASYARNVAKPSKKPFYLGVKAGYSVVHAGNSLEDNALSLELILGGNENSKFKVAPVVYLTDDMKNVVPGIKLGMALGKNDKDINI